MHDESLARHSHSFACLHELSPFAVREWHVWHGTPTQPISAASVAVASAGVSAAPRAVAPGVAGEAQ